MKKLLNLIERILPRYAWLPLTIAVVIDLSAYYISRLITSGLPHYGVVLPIDGMIPFFAPAILFYVLAYAQWALSYIAFCRESRDMCIRILFSDVFIKVICFIVFIVFPTEYARPEAVGDGFFVWLTRFIYATDSPDNLFPSIHCLESWMCFRAVMKCRRVPRSLSILNGIVAVLVFASTLLTKQHLILDVPSGILFAEVGLFAGWLIKPEKRLFKQKQTITS